MKIKRRSALAGFTLIEVMIATAISGLVMAAMIGVFSAQQKMYYRQTSLVRAQANARASLSIISREIRMAGYTGLPLGLAHINDPQMGTGPGSIFPVMWLQNGGTAFTPSTGSDLVLSSKTIAAAINAVSNTVPPGGDTMPDAFEIYGNFARGLTGLSVNIPEASAVTTISIPAAGLQFFQNDGFNRPAFVAVGNNDRTEIFTFVSASAGSVATLTVSGNAIAEFKSNTEIGGEGNVVLPIFRRVYFVDTKNTKDSNGVVTGTLYVANYDADGVLSGHSVELARDVQEFQVRYNLRDSNNWTVTQDQMTDPCSVVGLQLRIRNKGWESADGELKMNRDLISVIRIRNSGLGMTSCPVL